MRRALAAVRVPIRCINAASMPTRVETNRRYAPDFDAVIMQQVGHFPMLERPEEFNRLLAQAVAEIAAGAR
jgi:pimeloyl-ACP methyl ester carboxylesterase